MRAELPGFYFDAEKNRYFPIRGPIPGSASQKPAPIPIPTEAANLCRRPGGRASKLLHVRELNGNVIGLSKGKCNFKEEFKKIQASQPVVWKYRMTDTLADVALEQLKINVQTPEGQTETNALLTGSINGSLSLFAVDKVGRFDNGHTCIPDQVSPLIKEHKVQHGKAPESIWRSRAASIQMSSNISCIKFSRKHSSQTSNDGCNGHRALITTLGSDRSGGSLVLLNLVEASDFNLNKPIIRRRILGASVFDRTIWTADISSCASRAVIGTNKGADLVNLETGTPLSVLRTKSDVLAQQLDQSANVALCGLRNGSIITVDVRERQRRSSDRLIRHQIPYPSFSKTCRNKSKQWFEVNGHINTSEIMYMPSSISCLLSLQHQDQYFLASSMDGSIKLYDHRLTKRGPVQCYEGNVNSHTRIQLGVDESESFVMSGGEDCYLRLWSIKSGQLLFQEKFSNSILSTVSWKGGLTEMQDGSQGHGSGAWLGSEEGVFHMCWS